MKYSGTSMAAPNVANLAAKLIALSPTLTPAQTIDLLTRGASPMVGYPNLAVIDGRSSVGLLDAKKGK